MKAFRKSRQTIKEKLDRVMAAADPTQVAAELGAPFAPPHIERWCNGWQVRAHFFAYFKYEQYKKFRSDFIDFAESPPFECQLGLALL